MQWKVENRIANAATLLACRSPIGQTPSLARVAEGRGKMVSSDLRLMPEQPGKGPPSSAPLSVEDADRLAESFTPFWEDDGLSSAMAAPAPVVAQTPAIVTPLGVGPAPLTLPKKPINKQTLLGMAPLTGTPAPAAAAPSSAATQPLPVVAASATATPPGPRVAAKSPHKQTLLGFSPPLPATPAPLAPPATPFNATAASELSELAPEAAASALPPVATVHEPVAAPLAVQGAANVPGYATKYTPKDGPATPAVVIAPEAQSSPEANKRPLSTTQPSRVRAAPAPVAASPLAASVSDDIYPHKKRTGLWIAASVVVVLLLGAVVGMHALSDNAPAPAAAAASAASATPVSSGAAAASPTPDEPSAVAAPVVAAPTVEPTSPPAVASASATDTPEPASRQATIAHAKTAKPKSEVAPAARPAPHPAATATFPAEPSAPKSGKSVIVRDAPF
jgi:DNA segregation ATPase FtsK/SpoIIIE, S-DNA-T family